MQIDTGHRRNNFDLLRIAAAVMVLVGHAYVLSGREEPIARATGIGGLGEIGVSIFFVISGFLVSASWTRRPQLRAFLAARLLRILPGLGAAVVLTAFVLGPIVTSLPPARYFAEAATWLYPLRNLLLYPVTYALPGVFEGLPYPNVANGSLWTLRLEFSCYLLTPVLWACARGRAGVVAAVAVAASLLFVVCAVAGPSLPPIALIGARNLYLFLAGAALFSVRAARWLSGPAAGAAAALATSAALSSPGWAPVAFPLVLPWLVVAFAQTPLPGLSSVSRWGDYSYGVYIYAFPVQQTLIQAAGPGLSVAAFAGLTVLCTAPLAVGSWLLVEKPALDLKARFRRGG